MKLVSCHQLLLNLLALVLITRIVLGNSCQKVICEIYIASSNKMRSIGINICLDLVPFARSKRKSDGFIATEGECPTLEKYSMTRAASPK